MNLKKCRQILNAIALLVVIIVFASNIPLFNSIHKEMIYVSIFTNNYWHYFWIYLFTMSALQKIIKF